MWGEYFEKKNGMMEESSQLLVKIFIVLLMKPGVFRFPRILMLNAGYVFRIY